MFHFISNPKASQFNKFYHFIQFRRRSIFYSRIHQRHRSIRKRIPGRIYRKSFYRVREYQRRWLRKYKYGKCSHDWLSGRDWERFSKWNRHDYWIDNDRIFWRSEWWPGYWRTWSSGEIFSIWLKYLYLKFKLLELNSKNEELKDTVNSMEVQMEMLMEEDRHLEKSLKTQTFMQISLSNRLNHALHFVEHTRKTSEWQLKKMINELSTKIADLLYH